MFLCRAKQNYTDEPIVSFLLSKEINNSFYVIRLSFYRKTFMFVYFVSGDNNLPVYTYRLKLSLNLLFLLKYHIAGNVKLCK